MQIPDLDVSIHTIDGLAVLEFEATGRGEGKIDPDYYALVKQSVTRLQAAQTLNDFCRIVTEEVRRDGQFAECFIIQLARRIDECSLRFRDHATHRQS